MATPPNFKRFIWMYETTAGTTLMDLATDVTYYFGIYNDDVEKWNIPSIENEIVNYHTYNTRNPTMLHAGVKMPPFKHTYIPTSAQHLVWQMGKVTDASPNTFAAADYNKEQYAISIRNERTGGTNNNHFQMNGCFSVKLYGVIQAGNPYTVEQTWEYMNFEDLDTGAKPIITDPINYPDTSETPYVGLPTIVYDFGGGGAYTVPNPIKFDYTVEAIYSQAYTNTTKTAQVVHKERFKPITFTMTCVTQVNDMWTDLLAHNGAKEIKVTLYKADPTEYIVLDLTNCRWQKFDETAEGFEGLVMSTLYGQAEALSGSFTDQGTFATHFKGETT